MSRPRACSLQATCFTEDTAKEKQVRKVCAGLLAPPLLGRPRPHEHVSFLLCEMGVELYQWAGWEPPEIYSVAAGTGLWRLCLTLPRLHHFRA